MSEYKLSDTAQVSLFNKDSGEQVAFGEVQALNTQEKLEKQYKYKVEITTPNGEMISYGTDKLEFSEDGKSLETNFASFNGIELDE